MALAAMIAVFALARDLRPAPTVQHPFARHSIAAGSEITATDVEMKPIPPDVFPLVDLPALAARPIDAGAPITARDTGPGVTAPEGWPSIAVETPFDAAPGSEVVLVVGGVDMVPITVPGVVTGTAAGGSFDAALTTIAVPPDLAIDVAVAHRTGQLEVLLGG